MSLWSGKLLEKLKELNGRAMSSSQIAAEINRLFSGRFSRSAIIGARHRAGLTIPERSTWSAEQRAAYSGGGYRRKEGSQRGKWQRVKLEEAIELYKDAPSIEDMFIPFGQRENLYGLTANNCHWPVGDPRNAEFFFCGGKAVEGRPYCASHCRVAYVKPREINPNSFRLQSLSVR